MRRAAVQAIHLGRLAASAAPAGSAPSGAIPACLSASAASRSPWIAPSAMANQSVSAGTAAAARLFSAESSVDSGSAGQQLIASLLVERLPVVIPKPPEWALKYESFSFERKQQYRKQYPKEFMDAAASTNAGAEGEGEEEEEYWAGVLDSPFDAPSRRTAADEANDV
ncbi:unnamed protein product, partial [Closterium sp. NIES-54]